MAARSWLLLLAPLLLGAPPAAPGPCPSGFATDPARARTIETRLSADAEARTLLHESAGAVICFGSGVEPGITPEGTILLPLDMPEPHAAARTAHLLHHRRAGSPLAGPPAGDCAEWVEQALAEEARGHALELRLLAAAGAPASESAHGVPAYAIDYAARCRQMKGPR
jgi:hypothetical protein